MAEKKIEVDANLSGNRVINMADAVDPTDAVNFQQTKGYVQSRNDNLITNGNGTLGTNYNFSSFIFDNSDVLPGTSGSFIADTQGAVFCDEFIGVEIEKEYFLSAAVKAGDSQGGNISVPNKIFIGIACYDIDENIIRPYDYHHGYGYELSSRTYLAADLVAGDTYIQLPAGAAAGWYDGSVSHARTINVYPLQFNGKYCYKAATGLQYQEYGYTRLRVVSGGVSSSLQVAGSYASVDLLNDRLNLTTPWAGATIPAGTKIKNTSSGASYDYSVYSKHEPSVEWESKTVRVGKTTFSDTGGYDSTAGFRLGTSKIKLLVLPNYQASTLGIQRIGGLILKQDNSLWKEVGSDYVQPKNKKALSINLIDKANIWAFLAKSNNVNFSGFQIVNNNFGMILKNDLGFVMVQVNSNGISFFKGGDIGIGTESPTENFDVNGRVRVRVRSATSAKMATFDANGVLGESDLPNSLPQGSANHSALRFDLGTGEWKEVVGTGFNSTGTQLRTTNTDISILTVGAILAIKGAGGGRIGIPNHTTSNPTAANGEIWGWLPSSEQHRIRFRGNDENLDVATVQQDVVGNPLVAQIITNHTLGAQEFHAILNCSNNQLILYLGEIREGVIYAIEARNNSTNKLIFSRNINSSTSTGYVIEASFFNSNNQITYEVGGVGSTGQQAPHGVYFIRRIGNSIFIK